MDITSYQGQVLETLDELLVALSETLTYEGELNLYQGDISIKITFEQSIEGRFIFIDTLLNDEVVISSRYDDDNDDSAHIFKKPLNKDELKAIADAVSEKREEL